MRSDLVFGASSQVSNRFWLCRLTTKATRKLHRPNSRLQDTINRALIHFQQANPETGAARAAPPAHPPDSRGDLTIDLDRELEAGLSPVTSLGDLRPIHLDDPPNEVSVR